jgi:hypothetical protein
MGLFCDGASVCVVLVCVWALVCVGVLVCDIGGCWHLVAFSCAFFGSVRFISNKIDNIQVHASLVGVDQVPIHLTYLSYIIWISLSFYLIFMFIELLWSEQPSR